MDRKETPISSIDLLFWPVFLHKTPEDLGHFQAIVNE